MRARTLRAKRRAMAKIDKKVTLETCIEAMERQGRPSVDENGACQYRGPNGLRCAAGHLIPDDEYEDWYEGSDAEEVAGVAESFFGHDLDLVEALQHAHDSAARTSGDQLARVEHGLEKWRDGVRSIVSELGIEVELPKGWG